jgi:uncharacterized membrane protein (UPF0127 family)
VRDGRARPPHSMMTDMLRYVLVGNKDKKLADPIRTKYCDSFTCRLRGLTFRRTLARDEGLLLVQRGESRLDSSIHMLAVWMDLTIVWINSALIVVDKTLARPWRLAYFPKSPAKYVLEIHPERWGDYEIGNQVQFIDV